MDLERRPAVAGDGLSSRLEVDPLRGWIGVRFLAGDGLPSWLEMGSFRGWRLALPVVGNQWRWNYFFAGGAHLTSDVATDFRVWGRIHDLKTYLPPKFCFSAVFGNLRL